MNDATQKGVSDDSEEVVGTNERLAEIEEIAAARRAERAEPEEEQEDQADQEEEQEKEQQEEQEEDQEPVVTLIIDGKEIQRKESEILEAGKRALQKESTADSRLEEATRLLREAERRAEQSPPPEQDVGSKNQSLSDDVIDYKQIVRTIQYGDEEEAAEALQNLIDHGRASGATQNNEPPVTRGELKAFLDEKSVFDAAVAEFQKPADQGGFGDIWEDPILRDMVIRKEAEKRDTGDKRPYGELFTEIGTEIRGWLDGKTGKPTQSTNLQDRQEKLKNQPTTIQGAGQRLSPESRQETKPKSRTEILEEMAAARGQLA